MSSRYGDRDYDRGRQDYGRRSDSDDDRSYSERSESRLRYGRDESEREGERYEGESKWRGQYGGSRSRGGEYGSEYGGGRSQSGGSQYGGGQYGGGQYGGGGGQYGGSQYGSGRGYGGSQYGSGGGYGGSQYGGGSRSSSRGREGYRPGSENDWDYTNDRESRYGSFVRGYDTGAYDDTSSGSSQRYNPSWGNYGERGRGYDYDRSRYGQERSGYGQERGDYGGQDRGWWDRASDEVASWFGDEEAERRRRMDEQRQRHRGKGPKGYRRSDERIKEDINDRLSEGYLDASEIEVAVSNGEVSLTGTVNSRSDKRRAEDIAEYVSGVTHVENRLRVKQSDIDRYPSLDATSSTGTTGTTGTSGTYGTSGTTGTTGATGTSGTSSSGGTTDTSSTGTTGATGTARGRTAGT